MDLSRRRFLGRRSAGTTQFRPPWSVPEALFAELCTRCDACLPACPTGLIKRGDGGLPVVDFSGGSFCNFCGDCSRACASGAISHELASPPWNFTIAIAASCLPQQGVECRVCGEACDQRAIRFAPRRGGVALPEIDADACTGCGACLSPCPAGAITRVVAATVALEAS